MRVVIIEKYKYTPTYVDGRSKNYIEQYRENQKKDLIRRVSNLVEVFPDTIGVDIYFNKISSQAKLDISNVNTKEEEAFEYYLKIGANVEF